MFGKRQGWKSAHSSWRKVRSGMVKAELLETQSPGCKPTGERRLIEALAEVMYAGLCP
jgi:hypothetical protein